MSLLNLFNKKETPPPSYQVGQEWQYHTRPGEEASTIKITKIETYKEIGKMVHIAVSGVKIKNPKYPDAILEEILHLPYAEFALRKSTTQLKNDRCELPDYEFGYVRWRAAFDEDNAGYFGIPLREAIQWLEDGTYEVK